MTDLLISDVRPWGADPVDLLVADGVLAEVVPTGTAPRGAPAARRIAGHGLLALPGLVNAHAHVDKSWWGRPWESYEGAPGVQGRIAHERARRDDLGIPSVATTRAVLDQLVRHGTTAVRSHVDVDLGLGLRGIEVVREAAAAYDGLRVELVAFPQDGVLRRPGVMELLDRAAAAGVEHVGGLDPASIDRDPVGQLDGIFDVAARHGCGIDLHLHDGGELGAFQVELVVERTERFGLQGRVTLAHGFAVAQVDQVRRRDLLQAMGALGITMTTVAPLGSPQLPVAELDAAGVGLGLGTDGIRDLWSPYGTGDVLGIAWQLARASGLARDADLRRVVELATSDGGRFVGGPTHDLVAGSRADVVLLEAENPMDALVRTPPRRLVVAGGRVLHDDLS
ncbi:amidohydrolase family protein [Nocardioides aurantiacus]|uniref:amidohydrolase family protein n=1 Tax=Nocardioides aurantiacus TaxID=86796 RepID=UPI000F49B2FB|nr:amidohydrolase family protein [Nocardioides aurantiacus]